MLFLRILIIAFVSVLPAVADDAAPEDAPTQPAAQEFSGSGTTTTGFFKIADHWEVRWNARQVVSVAVMSKDGTIVAGAAGVLRGSLFVPLGGQYYLKITDGTTPVTANPAPTSATTENASPLGVAKPTASTNAPPPAAENPSPFGVATPAPSTHAPPAASTNAAPVPPGSTNLPAADTADSFPPIPAPASSPVAAETSVAWHVQVVQLGTSVSANQALTVYTPFFVPPDSAVTPAAPPPPPPVLTSDQAQTVVKIKGDKAQGAGFLLRTPDGVYVLTHRHLLDANPNVKIFTMDGVEIPALGVKGALNRDLAMFTIRDNHYTFLPLATGDTDKVDSGNPLIIPDIAGQTNPLLGNAGRIIGVTAERIDFDNKLRPNSSGAPVIVAKTGAVIAVVTTAKQVDVTDHIAQAWPANPAPGSAGIIPYYGLRLSSVTGWETYDPQRFLAETLFLQQFQRTTRCLDSFLNGKQGRSGDEETGRPNRNYFQKEPKLKAAFDSYKKYTTDADDNQKMEAVRELLSDLEGVAKSNVDTIQRAKGLYTCNQACAAEYLAYRNAIQKQLDALGNKLPRLNDLAQWHQYDARP